MSDEKKETAEVKEVEWDGDIDSLLGTKAATVIAPDEESKRSVLESTKVDSSFLDNDLKNDQDDEDDSKKGEDDSDDNSMKTPPTKDDLADALGDPTEDDDEDEDDPAPQNKGGRKPALVEAMNKLVDNGTIQLFEDAQDISKYTNDEIVELIEANIAEKVNETAQKAPMEIFSQLDPKVQEVVAFNLNGGKDVLPVLKNVIRSQEIANLDPNEEQGAERIVREWLRETNFGTEEEIEEEITAYIDRNELDKKANQFKPKLDKKQAEIMERRLAEQEEKRQQAEQAKKTYADKVFQTLNQPHLNGLPLNNRVQTALFYGITETDQYQDRDGNPTNELGYLIEQYQLNPKANMGVLLEALWLLKDPQGYRDNVQSIGQQKAVSDTYRKLKTAEGARKTASSKQGEQRQTPPARGSVKRKKGRNIFSRD
jgi:hypothetical protein